MILASIFWCLVAIAAPAVAKTLEDQFPTQLNKWHVFLRELGPWLHGLIWPYLAVIGGVVLGYDFGLYGHSPSEWLTGLIACGAGLGASVVVLRQRPINTALILSPVDTLHEEPRWALYRSAALLWIPNPLIAIGVGAGMGVIEWGLLHTPWRKSPSARESTMLLRILFSAVMYAATRNFWLTAGTQLGFLLLARAMDSSES